MDQCALQLRAEIKCPKGKAKEFVLVQPEHRSHPAPRRRLPCWPATTPLPRLPSRKEFGLTVAYGLNTLQKDLKYGDLMDQMANNYKKVTTVG